MVAQPSRTLIAKCINQLGVLPLVMPAVSPIWMCPPRSPAAGSESPAASPVGRPVGQRVGARRKVAFRHHLQGLLYHAASCWQPVCDKRYCCGRSGHRCDHMWCHQAWFHCHSLNSETGVGSFTCGNGESTCQRIGCYYATTHVAYVRAVPGVAVVSSNNNAIAEPGGPQALTVHCITEPGCHWYHHWVIQSSCLK